MFFGSVTSAPPVSSGCRMLQKIRDGLQGQRWLAIADSRRAGAGVRRLGRLRHRRPELRRRRQLRGRGRQGEKISLEEARNAWTQQQARFAQQFGGELPEAFRKQLQNELLEELIRNAVISQHATKQGYRVARCADPRGAARDPGLPGRRQVQSRTPPMRAACAGRHLASGNSSARSALELLRTQLQRGIQASDFATPARARAPACARG